MKQRRAIEKKSIILLFIFLLLFHQCTLTAWSAENPRHTMYLKSQSFAYLYPSINDDYAAAVYGKGETVRIVGWQKGYYIVCHLNQKLYLPEAVLTQMKPKWSYFAEAIYRKLTLRKNSILYSEPAKSAATVFCGERQIYTIGETNRWYKVFLGGKVFFIRKDSEDILKDEKAVFPDIIISCSDKADNFRKRIQYFYCLLPDTARHIVEEGLTIHVTDYFEKEKFEQMGAGAYACSNGNIYLKENSDKGFSGMIERCLLHEIGHMIQYNCRSSAEEIQEAAAGLMQRDSLELREYYRGEREYLAETFEIYVKSPEKLKRHAPDTWKYFNSLMLS